MKMYVARSEWIEFDLKPYRKDDPKGYGKILSLIMKGFNFDPKAYEKMGSPNMKGYVI